ncbi:MAG: sulfite exporter TauE/SafE family protein [Candidatus Moraniibacteriota bacterium]
MNKTTIDIAGMHCRSCEILIEDKLTQIAGVQRAVVNYKKGTAEIHYGAKQLNMNAVDLAVREAGYSFGQQNGTKGKGALFSKNPQDYKDLFVAALVLIGLYLILKNLGLTSINVGGSASNPSSLPVIFLVGLTAGLSTCMALVGGLILGISARHAELHPEATPMQKFRPHLFFNAGRVASYALLGGTLGSLGSLFQLSGGTLGVLTIVVGVVMLMLGMKLIGIFPRMENGGLMLPKGISRFLGIKKHHDKEYSHRGSMITGALTFFLPCGFTQAMQLYAISTGSFTQGALIMGIFALGTAPGLLGVGGLTSVIKGVFAQRFFKFAGILVIFLAVFNIANGYNLTGWQLGSGSGTQSADTLVANDPNVKLENGVQVVRMTEGASGYAPNKFTIRKGVPVRWIIDAQSPYSCASSIMMSKFGIKKSLKAGENVIEFTPTETGAIPFSCSMGMYTGVFTVVDNQGVGSATSTSNAAGSAPTAGSCGGGTGGGCGGCGGGKSVTPTVGSVQSAPSTGGAVTPATEQIINTTYTYANDIQPNTFKVKAGQPVRFVVDVKEDGAGCMSTIMIPGLSSQPQLLQKGSKLEMTFTPEKKGVYNITCAMGVPRGTLTVE